MLGCSRVCFWFQVRELSRFWNLFLSGPLGLWDPLVNFCFPMNLMLSLPNNVMLHFPKLRDPNIDPKNTRILIMGAPKKVPLILGNSNINTSTRALACRARIHARSRDRPCVNPAVPRGVGCEVVLSLNPKPLNP